MTKKYIEEQSIEEQSIEEQSIQEQPQPHQQENNEEQAIAKTPIEPILQESSNRFIVFPIEYHSIWRLYKEHVASFWTLEEIDLSEDIKQWGALNANDKFFIKNVLAFFACSDGIVMENLAQRFMTEVEIAEVRAFYSFEMAMEQIHAETYGMLIETYIKNEDERRALFESINNVPTIKEKADWALKHINGNEDFATRLLVFICVEGIFFSGSFCAIFWLKKRGLMPGLTFSNELISRDEGLHVKFGIELYKLLQYTRKTQNKVHEIFKEAFEIECEFIEYILPASLIGMNSKLMVQYIEFVADHLLLDLGYSKLFNVVNPFEWMNMISIEGKTNFFEKRVGEYEKAGVMSGTEGNKFRLDEDF